MLKQAKDKLVYTQGIVSIIANIILFVIKYWAGVMSNSVSLIADAWHTLSDSLSSMIVITGTKLSTRKATHKHPFGYGRWQQIATIFVAVLLFIVAFEFGRESVIKFVNRKYANFGTIAIVVTVISILLKEALARYALYIGKKTDNSIVSADGWHHRSDALSSIVILLGILLRDYFWWIDSLLGILVAILIFYTAYMIIKEAISVLLGVKPPPELIDKIMQCIFALYESDLKAHHFQLHDYGDHKELVFHIKLDEKLDLKTAHDIATDIENHIKEELQIEATIHIEPLQRKCKMA